MKDTFTYLSREASKSNEKISVPSSIVSALSAIADQIGIWGFEFHSQNSDMEPELNQVMQVWGLFLRAAPLRAGRRGGAQRLARDQALVFGSWLLFLSS